VKCLVCGVNHAACKGKVGEPVAIVDIKRRTKMANKNDYVSDKRVYVDRDGKVVDEKDPARHTLVVAAGGSIPHERALELGLVKEGAVEDGAAPATGDEAATDSGDGAIDAAEESARIQSRTSTKRTVSRKK
jgi:hypothetical protein